MRRHRHCGSDANKKPITQRLNLTSSPSHFPLPMRLQQILGPLILLATAMATPIVDLGYARYQGMVNTDTNVTTFLGIRYAAAPMNGLRFHAPTPPTPVTDLQQAIEQPAQCYQDPSTGTSPTNPLRRRQVSNVSSEDCLFLRYTYIMFVLREISNNGLRSVYYPSDAVGVPVGGLPTLIYIHGGGYFLGSSSQFRGTDLIAQSNRGVVVVIVQYRLGLFGFLAGNKVKKNGALNAGLLDQEFALRWVNKHISKFGGDPSKVVVWGESAGAGSVLQQIVANGGQTKPQLFRGAITSSTYLPSQYNYNDPIPEFLYNEVVSQANCTNATDSMACLRATDVQILATANQDISAGAFFGTVLWTPVVDGEFIQQRPTLSLAQGKVNGEALLSVTNAFEGTIFVNQTAATSSNATQFAFELFPQFSSTDASRVGSLYAGLGAQPFQSNAILGESILICPTYFLLRAFAGRAFKGEFAIPPGFHGADIEYYFPSVLIDVPEIPTQPLYNNTAFIDAFAQSFISFAISLDPNVKVDPQSLTPEWNKWDKERRTEMVFNKTEADIPHIMPAKTSEALLERCRFWESVGGITGQ
ncbi:Carboxylic ester hydrolase [Mycena venus]|uniref:Carboxylic ester hydrolase n=1 Tax=Mycena venus TaxID=2733690 RepID=A0A8H6XKE7_9AGAR|nr:Carboxylic ester hydrolase [Mycena venus]